LNKIKAPIGIAPIGAFFVCRFLDFASSQLEYFVVARGENYATGVFCFHLFQLEFCTIRQPMGAKHMVHMAGDLGNGSSLHGIQPQVLTRQGLPLPGTPV
jgi:hypothetical protein